MERDLRIRPRQIDINVDKLPVIVAMNSGTTTCGCRLLLLRPRCNQQESPERFLWQGSIPQGEAELSLLAHPHCSCWVCGNWRWQLHLLSPPFPSCFITLNSILSVVWLDNDLLGSSWVCVWVGMRFRPGAVSVPHLIHLQGINCPSGASSSGEKASHWICCLLIPTAGRGTGRGERPQTNRRFQSNLD